MNDSSSTPESAIPEGSSSVAPPPVVQQSESAMPTPAPLPTFLSEKWGEVTVHRGQYHNGALAVHLTTVNSEDDYPDPLAKLSVNFDHSADLPENCFHVKEWSENEEIAADAMASGLFKLREDIPAFDNGFVTSPVWEML